MYPLLKNSIFWVRAGVTAAALKFEKAVYLDRLTSYEYFQCVIHTQVSKEQYNLYQHNITIYSADVSKTSDYPSLF